MLSANPLRISQESLDLEDIISDLNSEVSHQSQKPKAKKEEPKQKQQPLMKGKGPNKENDATMVNRLQESTAPKTKQAAAAKEHTTGETKATSNANGQDSCSASASGNQRYASSNAKQELTLESEEELRVPTPFYMKNAPLASDEDVESFQRKLDTLIVNFRSETLSEFMKTKKQVLSDQAQTIDAERRRCNTLLGVKQNEIEQLKEGLATKSKLCDDLSVRCEGMAFWAGKSKTLLRIKLLQYRAFEGLKQFRDFSKHSKRVLQHRMRQFRENQKRKVFLGWEQHYKQWKVVKNREDFEKAVKMELQHICAQYNKEIESLREKLQEATEIVNSEHRNKAMMQENLKKAFMRGVCALNFEAMNILQPSDQNYQQQIEREMERQVVSAMNSVAQQSPFMNNEAKASYAARETPPNYQSIDVQSHSPQSLVLEAEHSYQESKQMQQFESAQAVNPFVSITESTSDYKRVESKDSMWKPAPIMGREINPQVTTFTYSQPTITSQLKAPANVVLSNHFSQFAQQKAQPQMNNDLVFSRAEPTLTQMTSHVTVSKVNEDTEKRTLAGNPTVIQNASTLPDFAAGGTTQQQAQGEGKTIFAGGPPSSSVKGKANTVAAKRPTPTHSSSQKKSK